MATETVVKKYQGPILARPDQSLYTHLKNMINEMQNHKEILLKLFFPHEEKITKKFIEICIDLILIAHDFGKINPYFQEKISKNSKKKNVIVYHSQVSGIFAWILANKIIEEYENKNEKTENMYLHTVAAVYAILNHHNRMRLPNSPGFSISKYGSGMTYETLAEIIEKINENYPKEKCLPLTIKENRIRQTENDENRDPIIELLEEIAKEIPEIRKWIKEAVEEFRELDSEEIEYIFDEIAEQWEYYQNQNKLFHAILFYFSILCDLDEWDAKAHINDKKNKHKINFEHESISLRENIVENYKNKIFGGIDPKTTDPLLKIKDLLWEDVNLLLKKDLKAKIISITYPTGSGKTLAYLHLSMNLRKRIQEIKGYVPRIIYCLPYISITDQVGEELRKVIASIENKKIKEKLENLQKQSDLMITHHHLAEAEWSYFAEKDEEEQYEINKGLAKEFVNLWNSNIIVTTYVSFWNSIFGGKKRNYMRFHRLVGSIIIFDEIQSIPIKYWQIISIMTHQLCSLLQCTVIVGSATNPKAITYPYEWNNYLTPIEEIRAPKDFKKLNRYKIYYHPGRKELQEFANEAKNYVKENREKSIMFIMNTKESARLLFDYLKNKLNIEQEIYFLSSAVTHRDRKEILDKLKNQNVRRILVCTQVIEAGIDLSFDVVFRDMAPLDSIIQAAGRCNRYNKKEGEIHVIELTQPNRKFRTYSSIIYDLVMLEQTKKVLEKNRIIEENELQELIEKYYNVLTLEGEKKAINECVEEYNQNRIEELTKRFRLIEEKEDETLIICNKRKEFIEAAIKADTKRTKGILIEYRDKSIAISKKIREKLMEKVKIETVYETEEISVWAVIMEENPWVYQKNGGLNIPVINGTEPLE